jgi:flagellar motor switch protein FliG
VSRRETRHEHANGERQGSDVAAGPPADERLPDSARARLEALAALPAEALAEALQGEQTQTVALVLNTLPEERAGEVMQRLAPEVRREVPLRLSRLGSLGPELLGRLAEAVLLRARALERAKLEAPLGSGPDERVNRMAGLMRALERTERLEALAALEEQEPEAAAKVRELLYQFEDLLRIQDRSIQKLLSEIDSKSLAQALKGAPEAIAAKVTGNLSNRAREAIQEEMELLGTVPASATRQAQKLVVDAIQRLDQAGELQMDE